MSKLNGIKVLLWGNHDKGINTMYNCGFDVVLMKASILIHKTVVTMTHCPLLGVKREDLTHIKNNNSSCWHGDERLKHQHCSTDDTGQFHLHGHIHSRSDKKSSVKILGKQYDIGVTANNYRPVSISQIESWIHNYVS